MSRCKVLVLGGDGIGPEVVAHVQRLADAVADRARIRQLRPDTRWRMEAYGIFCSDKMVAAAKVAYAVLVGVIVGPRWDGIKVPRGRSCRTA
jgi:isocitrate/isopropylmalate dehydrogenase